MRGILSLAHRSSAAILTMSVAACSSSAGSDDTSTSDNGGLGGYSATGGYAGPGSGGFAPVGGSGGLGGYGGLGNGGWQGSVNSGGQFGSGGGTGGIPFGGAGGLITGSGGTAPGSGGATGGSAGASPIPDGGSGGPGTGGAGGQQGDADCSGGHPLLASDASGGGATPVKGYGEVNFQVPTNTQILELKTTLTVPTNPTTSSTLFIWPGLEPLPGGTNYNPIGIGVLQPVLTWGTSCAPGSPTSSRGWWISGQYVNPYTFDQAHSGCKGGNVIDVQVGDALDITMSLKGTVWSQVVVDRQSGQTASYDIDMAGQAQDWALFKIEIPTQTKPASDIVFTSTTLTFAASQPAACQPSQRGANDYFPAPVVSADGTKCCVSRIILRAQGVPATTPNTP